MGVLRACQVFGRYMLKKGYGRVINITSLNAFVALHEVAAYAASEAVVQSLTWSLAVEWAGPWSVRECDCTWGFSRCTQFGVIARRCPRQELLMRTPMKRFGNADEVVGAALLLASDAASFMTGSVVIVDGGFLASGVNQ